MLSKKMIDALNEHMNKEMYSAYLYMSMSAHSDSMGLKGFANWFMDLAIEEKDHATRIFLQWYVTEQVEEEENDNEIIDQLRLIGDNPQGLLMLDRELGGRPAGVPLDYAQGVKSGSEGD